MYDPGTVADPEALEARTQVAQTATAKTKPATPRKRSFAEDPRSAAQMARELQRLIGRRLLAHMTKSEPRTVSRWIAGESQPRGEHATKLRLGYQLVERLRAEDPDELVQAYLVGMNPDLNDETILDAVRAGEYFAALAAVRRIVVEG